jgi:hypothetical protein
MILMAQDRNERYQCYLMEREDLKDPVGMGMLVDARFLDSPYVISENTRKAAEEIVRAGIENCDQAHFLLWDSMRQRVVGQIMLDHLGPQNDMPELTGLYIEKQARGRRLSNQLHEGVNCYLQENGYTQVKGIVDHRESRKSAMDSNVRNGFKIVSEGDNGIVLVRSIKPADDDRRFEEAAFAF